MKPRAHILQSLLAAFLPLAVAGPLALFAAPPPQPAKTEIQPAVSVFVYPNNTSEGRDPFFPASSRAYITSPDKLAHPPSLTDLVVKTIIGTPPRVFAVINNHTFAPGDDGDVTLKDGRRLHIRVLDINPQAGTVTIEASGATVTLTFTRSP
jgi:hypothetical protein